MNEEQIAGQFPVTGKLIHLNHAAVGPWPRVTAELVSTFAEENCQQGSLDYPRWLEAEQQLRQQAAELINVPGAESIALIKSTSEGLSFVAYGLEWQQGDNVVGIRQEFPSNRFAWASLEQRGVEFRQLDLDSCGPDPEEALLQLCDSRTRLIAVSAVQYASGLRMNLLHLGEVCRQRNILFCVDAIQQLGALEFDVQAINADFVVADGHKWMLGPEGLGLFYIRPESLEQLRLTQFGWHMVDEPGDYTASDFKPAADARRFECGSPNMVGIHALNSSLGLIQEIGIEAIETRIRERIEMLRQGLEVMSTVEIISDMRPLRRSGIITFRRVDRESQTLLQHLQRQGVFAAERGGGIRLSPHFYTPFSQLEQTLELIHNAP